MFETGDLVLVFLVSGYSPMAIVGRVVRPIGLEGAELADAVHARQCDGAQWGKLAEGDKEVRRAAQQHYRYIGVTKFAGCRDFRPWIGCLPEASS